MFYCGASGSPSNLSLITSFGSKSVHHSLLDVLNLYSTDRSVFYFLVILDEIEERAIFVGDICTLLSITVSLDT